MAERAEATESDVLVLGAGAAGLMCAATARGRGRRVVALDRNPLPGRKILISGGGRCNFTNLYTDAARFLSANPHFAKSALASYQPRHFIELVERHRIPYHEKTLGQLFCDDSAHRILSLLLAECGLESGGRSLGGKNGSVVLRGNTHILAVERDGADWRVETSQGEFRAGALVVATGGLSIPKLGATGLGYELARQFGLGVLQPRPALVPLLLGGEEAGWLDLAGVSTEVVAEAGQAAVSRTVSQPARFQEKMLVTHRGLSGPAILQASSYWAAGEPLWLDLAPHVAVLADLLEPRARRDAGALRQALRQRLPQRLADYLATVGAPSGWSNSQIQAAERRLHRWAVQPAGTEGFAKAEVTAGGVDTDALDARTMEARAVAGLFFVGEVVDVTGHLGGFNFQWAWASAVAAGRAL